MPLKQGKKNMRHNIGELVTSYKKKGTIGNVKPKSKKHAVKIASAIAYRQAKKG